MKSQSPEKLISTLSQLSDRIKNGAEHIAEISSATQGRWERLGAIGAQRADYAAELLAELIPALLSLGTFAHDAAELIRKVRADPFAE